MPQLVQELDQVRDRADDEEEDHEPRVHQHHHKVFSIHEPHAVIQPRAVVVHVQDALVAR